MKVVILAGGLGTRLAEETSVKPKPMVEVGGMPILWHIMKTYSHFSHNEFYVALGYKGHVIKEYFSNYLVKSSDITIDLSSHDINFKNKTIDDWKVHLYDTGHDTLTGGRLHRLESYLKDEEYFMLTYGDGVANVNIDELVKFHKSHGKIATVTAVRPPARFGAMEIKDGKVLDFHEKPQVGEGWINGGFFVFSPKVFNYLNGDMTILEREPLEGLVRDGKLMSYEHDGFWHCMDTVRDRDVLNKFWATGEAPWKVWS